MSMISRLIVIITVVLIMGGIVFLGGEFIRRNHGNDSDKKSQVYSPSDHHNALNITLTSEKIGTKPVSISYDNQTNTDSNIRSLKKYYERRAYAGAPPVIPHEVDAEINRTQRCNTCHEKGGFVQKFNAHTPITPHPEFLNCTQCHVPAKGKTLFVQTEWKSVKTPKIKRPALPGSPPPMPHGKQLRENCLACHAGPAVPLEIRTTHPERENCRQCHVPRETQGVFKRQKVEDE